MEKLLAKNQNYYRVNLNTGNMIYFGHSFDVKDDEYLEITIKDIIYKIDELVQSYNDLSAKLMSCIKVLPSADHSATIEVLLERVALLEKLASEPVSEIHLEDK